MALKRIITHISKAYNLALILPLRSLFYRLNGPSRQPWKRSLFLRIRFLHVIPSSGRKNSFSFISPLYFLFYHENNNEREPWILIYIQSFSMSL